MSEKTHYPGLGTLAMHALCGRPIKTHTVIITGTEKATCRRCTAIRRQQIRDGRA